MVFLLLLGRYGGKADDVATRFIAVLNGPKKQREFWGVILTAFPIKIKSSIDKIIHKFWNNYPYTLVHRNILCQSNYPFAFSGMKFFILGVQKHSLSFI